MFAAMTSYACDPVEESKSQKFSPLVNEMVPYYMAIFENIVTENHGFFVNGKVSNAYLSYDSFVLSIYNNIQVVMKCL